MRFTIKSNNNICDAYYKMFLAKESKDEELEDLEAEGGDEDLELEDLDEDLETECGLAEDDSSELDDLELEADDEAEPVVDKTSKTKELLKECSKLLEVAERELAEGDEDLETEGDVDFSKVEKELDSINEAEDDEPAESNEDLIAQAIALLQRASGGETTDECGLAGSDMKEQREPKVEEDKLDDLELEEDDDCDDCDDEDDEKVIEEAVKIAQEALNLIKSKKSKK